MVIGQSTDFEIVNADSNYGNNDTLTFDAGNNDATIKVGTVQSTVLQIYNVSWDTTQASSIDKPLNLTNQASFTAGTLGPTIQMSSVPLTDATLLEVEFSNSVPTVREASLFHINIEQFESTPSVKMVGYKRQ